MDETAALGNLEPGKVRVGSNRSFGVTFALVFGVLAVLSGLKNSTWWWAWVVAACVVLAVGLIRPALLGVPNRAWHKFGLLLGRFTTPVVMAVLYFGTVVPTGLFMRARRRDLLNLRWDSSASTYWVSRNPPGPDPSSMKNPF